jgi:hypothetical protein
MRSSVLIAAVLVVAFSDPVSAQALPPNGGYPATSPPEAFPSQPTPPPPAPAANAPDNSGLAPVYSRVASFTIPFSVAQPDKQTMEVLLFVSHDYGATWVLYSRQPATQGQFTFQTNQDGDYWFASRTNPIGTVVSAGATFRPELRVIVDTSPPRLDVQAVVNPRGEIQVDWQAVDDQIAPETLKIEYQQAIGQPYRAVQVTPAGSQAGRNSVGGRTAWMPEPGSYFVSVRVQVQDRAGNPAEVIRRIILPIALNSRPAAPSAAAAAPPIEASVPSDPFAAYGMAAASSVPPQPASIAGQEVQKPASPAAPEPIAWPSDSQRPGDQEREAIRSQNDAPPPPSENAANPAAAAPQADSSAAESAGDSSSSHRNPIDGVPAREVAVSSDGGLVDHAPGRNDQLQDPRPAITEAGRSTAAGTVDLPPGERPRMTSSKRFNLDYSVDAAGPAGVEKIELWVTRNGGRDWDLDRVDEDRESPLLVEVTEEGIYGFRVVIVGKNGLASQTPRSGDLADLWVGVDATKPTVEITSAAYGSEDHAGQLDIRWTAGDDHLGSRPVTLSFSAQADGPWTTIAASLPNSGQYFWRVDSRVPDEFYLRLEVRDEAGNVAVHRLDQPLQSAGLTPKGSIRGFEPVGR